MLCPRYLIKRERDTDIVERLANEVAASWGNMSVGFPKDLPQYQYIYTFSETSLEIVSALTMTSSPFISAARFRLSSLFPFPRVALWMSVAK